MFKTRDRHISNDNMGNPWQPRIGPVFRAGGVLHMSTTSSQPLLTPDRDPHIGRAECSGQPWPLYVHSLAGLGVGLGADPLPE